MSDEQVPAIIPADALKLSFPAPQDYIPSAEAEKTRGLIKRHGVFTQEGEAFVGKPALPHLLATDQAGANQFYNNLPENRKLEDGNKKYAALSEVQGELSRRIQEPRDIRKRERMKDSEACLQTFRDHSELEKRRSIEESNIRGQLPAAKREAANAVDACQVTGEPFQGDAEVHHIERVADQPRKSLDTTNLLVVKKQAHRTIHDAGAHSPEDLKKLAEEKGWPYPACTDS